MVSADQYYHSNKLEIIVSLLLFIYYSLHLPLLLLISFFHSLTFLLTALLISPYFSPAFNSSIVPTILPGSLFFFLLAHPLHPSLITFSIHLSLHFLMPLPSLHPPIFPHSSLFPHTPFPSVPPSSYIFFPGNCLMFKHTCVCYVTD